MSKKFKLVEEDLSSPDIGKVKKVKKPTTFNLIDEIGIEEEQDDEVYTLFSVLYDYSDRIFKTIDSVLSYAAEKGFYCKVHRNGCLYGFWDAEAGFTKL